MTSDEPAHGTYKRYSRLSCRCDLCRAANTARHAELRRQRLERAAESTFEHGRSAYRNWGCRCDVCTAANTEASKPYGAAYYRRHPERLKARQAQYRAANAEKVAAAARARRDRNAAKYAAQAQRSQAQIYVETLNNASRYRYQWTGVELELAARKDLSSRTVALMIGRTAYAVRDMRRRLADPVDPRQRMLAFGPVPPSSRSTPRRPKLNSRLAS